MEEEKKKTIEEKQKVTKKPKRKMNNKAKKRLIILTAIAMLVIILILIVVISRITSQTSSNVGKQDNDTYKNNEEPDETQKPEEQDNTLSDGKTDEKPNEDQPQEPNQSADNQDLQQQTKTGKEKYYIRVNNQANVVTIYKKDANGYYTIPYKAMVCSIGTATPESGTYKTSDKYTWRKLFGHTEGTYVYGQYATRIVKSILFHSVPYQNPNDPSSLEYWEYDKLGTKASAGCIRLTVQDAKWIYDNCEKGTQVEFYSDPNPGPLGKPTAQKISNEASYVRGWDPTDPSGSNPWNTYTGNNENHGQPQQPVIEDNKNQNNNNDESNNQIENVETTKPNESENAETQPPQTEKPDIPSGGENGGEQYPNNSDNNATENPTTPLEET